MGEVLLTWGWNALAIVVPKGPDCSLFVRFRDNFSKLSYSDLSDIYTLEIEDELQPAKEEVIQLIKNTLEKKDFAYRGDYTQFMKLVLVALTGDTTNFKITQPGAVSKARWMSKAIYALDLIILKNKIQRELGKNPVIMTDQQIPLLERFVKFVCLVYVKWWIRCPLAAEAGLNDLQLLSTIRSYPDTTISKAVEQALHGHLWYLTEEQAPACLFSS